MSKVVIGIVAKHVNEETEQSRISSQIRDEVKQAIFDNGGIAIGIISPNKKIQDAGDNWLEYESLIDKENIVKQIQLCDGIILQGGITNEAFEPYIAKYCYDNNIPCLGICAGQNSVVRGLGGTTYKIDNPEKHNIQNKDYVHSIKIQKDSKFYSIVKKEKIMVNSRHKRTIKDCPYLDKVGFCEDGYADVVEAKNKRFYMGLRFHPESLYEIDENMNNIFKAFLEECRK